MPVIIDEIAIQCKGYFTLRIRILYFGYKWLEYIHNLCVLQCMYKQYTNVNILLLHKYAFRSKTILVGKQVLYISKQ